MNIPFKIFNKTSQLPKKEQMNSLQSVWLVSILGHEIKAKYAAIIAAIALTIEETAPMIVQL